MLTSALHVQTVTDGCDIHTTVFVKIQSGEIVKCSLYRYEDLNSCPRAHIKKPGVGQTCNARTEAEAGRPLGRAGQPAYSIRMLSANMHSHTDTSTHEHTNGNENKVIT